MSADGSYDDFYDDYDLEEGVYRRPAGSYVRPPTPLRIYGPLERSAKAAMFHQRSYRWLSLGDPVTVELVPEPGNPFHDRALAMDIDGQLAGYLSASHANWLQPLIVQANALGYHVLSDGLVERSDGPTATEINGVMVPVWSDEPTLGALITLPRLSSLTVWLNWPPERRAGGYVEPERLSMIDVRGTEPLLDELAGDRDTTLVEVALEAHVIDRGGRKGQTQTKVRLASNFHDLGPDR